MTPRQIPMRFSAPMVLALWNGRKTETRRIAKRPPWGQVEGWPEMVMGEQELDGSLVWYAAKTGCAARLPIAQPGDLIWVKETWRPLPGYSNWDLRIQYAADGHEAHFEDGDVDTGDWRFPKAAAKGNVSPLFMPKWASRMTLRVTDVKVERLHDINDEGAVAEGIEEIRREQGVPVWRNYFNGASLLANGGVLNPTASFLSLWNSINGPDAWDANPWVIVTRFEVINRNVLEVANG